MRCTDARIVEAPPGPDGMAAPIDVEEVPVSGWSRPAGQGEEPFDTLIASSSTLWRPSGAEL